MNKILLVDVHALAHRSYNGLPKLATHDGHPTGASYGFLRALFAQLRTGGYTHCACVYDAGGSNPRKASSDAYKGNRPPLKDELKVQIRDILELLPELGIPTIGIPGYEADDILHTLSNHNTLGEGSHFTIFTCDQDLYHSLREGRVDVLLFNTSAKKIKRVTVESLTEEKGETYFAYRSFIKAVVGDKSDNIKGVKGVGEKTVIKLLEAGASFKPLEFDVFRDNWDLIQSNMDLIRPIVVENLCDLPLSEYKVIPPTEDQFTELMDRYSFSSLATSKNYEVLTQLR